MAVIRIRGEWKLSLVEQGLALTENATPACQAAVLVISYADRARIAGHIIIGKESVQLAGRVKPGNPGVVVLSETIGDEFLQDGLEAILYIPPFWPNIDYEYDMLIGILTISDNSRIENTAIRGKPFSLSAVKGWPPVARGQVGTLEVSP